ncbi:aldo/keto reductase [Aureimonas fodinaquatilis]|uniref:Aldo/keto reductase n=1 Tax=Aureimonas fodinaquatilis TaxID=2565783 RepID=A0A5B0DWP6_9HYPH|nr:aldo/keto reductase [Aureimonas fodinaquatilis]KAA0970422.1 aldo/keto reductase [Aureimonas fodinaquatilis]
MKLQSVKDCFMLANGVGIPCVGFGTWKIPDGAETEAAVGHALAAGYRHIDTASAYRNETGVGRAVRESGIERDQIFITSKLRNPEHGYDNAIEAFGRTMDNLKLDYLDMYMVHWPIAKPHRDRWQEDVIETWRFFEEQYQKGTVRVLGVCNFLPHHLKPLLAACEVRPMVDQIEIHPSFLQDEAVAFCKAEGIQVEAWGPFANGKLFEVADIQEIARDKQRTVSQVTLRWLLQKDVLPLPKTTTPARIIENTQLFDFDLTDDEMRRIDAIQGCGNSGLFPDTVDF